MLPIKNPQPSFGSSKARHPMPHVEHPLPCAAAQNTASQKPLSDRSAPVPEGKDAGTRVPLWGRRDWLRSTLAIGTTTFGSRAWSQSESNRGITVTQVVDMSAAQQDISRDFLTGSRAAWVDLNARGGVQGKPVQHLVLETDGTTAQLQSAWKTAHQQASCVALSGCVGNAAAQTLTRHQLASETATPLPLVAPWLHQAVEQKSTDTVFDVFADLRAQITHALKSLASMGVPELGVAYATGQDTALAQAAVRQAAQEQSVKVQRVHSAAQLTQPIVLFVGGTPELHAFVGQLKLPAGRQCYVIALADVNLQVLAQMGNLPKRVSIIATQAVPLVSASLPVVRAYREALAKLYDDPPAPRLGRLYCSAVHGGGAATNDSTSYQGECSGCLAAA